MIPKKAILGLSMYHPGKPIEEVQREIGLEEVIKMASNENPFGCSEKVLPALAAEKEFFSLYPESTSPNLRAKLAEHLDMDPSRFIIGNGSDEIVQLIANTYLEPGTQSIMANRTFPRYDMVTRMQGATSVQVPLTNGVHHLEMMASAVTKKTRVVWICNPNNPTGTIVNHDELSSFLDQVPENVLVVIDEAYAEYVTDSTYPDSFSLLDHNPHLLILRTFSKAYGLAAFRIGYGVGHPDVLQHLHCVRDPFNVNRLAQIAAIAALEDEAFVSYCRNENRQGLEQITTKLNEWDLAYFPTQANFVLFDTKFAAEEAFNYLLHQGVIVRSGLHLGFPTHLRVTVGTRDQNERFLDALGSFLRSRDQHDTKNESNSYHI